MIRLINAQLFIMFKTRTFKVLCIIALVLSLLTVIGAKLMSSEEFLKNNLAGNTPQQQEEFVSKLQESNNINVSVVKPGSNGINVTSKDIFNPTGKEVFHGSFGSGVIEILMAVLIGIMVASEYSNGTIKNILAYGKKREQYYISKLIVSSVGMTIILAIMVGISTTIGSFVFGWGEPFDFSQIIHILKVFGVAVIVGISIVSLIMILAMLLKSNGSTIGVSILIFLGLPSAISFVYGKYSWLDKVYEITTPYNWAIATSINATNGDILKAVIFSFIILFFATVLGIMIFKKQDIK
ncbi:MAG: ABC transporter permease subunit [Clostridiaceae bacterium]